MGVPHPIPYQGSKRGLADTIIAYLPKDTGKVIEPFAGSAAISLAAARSHKAESFVINDANAPLIALWEKIIHQPQQIAAQYRDLWEEQRGREQEYYYLMLRRHVTRNEFRVFGRAIVRLRGQKNSLLCQSYVHAGGQWHFSASEFIPGTARA